jgi:hypothetical protein
LSHTLGALIEISGCRLFGLFENKRKQERENGKQGMLGMDGEKKAGSQFCVDITKRRWRLLGFGLLFFFLFSTTHPSSTSRLRTQGNHSLLPRSRCIAK